MLEDKREEKRDRGREEEGLQMCAHNWIRPRNSNHARDIHMPTVT